MQNTGNRPHRATVDDVADHYGVSTQTVYGWLKSDDPPPYRKVGRQYRFNLDDVDEWAKPEAA